MKRPVISIAFLFVISLFTLAFLVFNSSPRSSLNVFLFILFIQLLATAALTLIFLFFKRLLKKTTPRRGELRRAFSIAATLSLLLSLLLLLKFLRALNALNLSLLIAFVVIAVVHQRNRFSD